MTAAAALIPFLFQGAIMAVDEVYFHRKRGLKKWERLGHPLDTLSFVACLAFVLVVPPSEMTRWIYGSLALISCLFVTKDEWEHQGQCSAAENWLHAILFMLHPVLLIWAGYLWWTEAAVFVPVIATAAAASILFMIYQVWYWRSWA